MATELPFSVRARSKEDVTVNSAHRIIQLERPGLFKDRSLVNGEWVEASSGARFDVTGGQPRN